MTIGSRRKRVLWAVVVVGFLAYVGFGVYADLNHMARVSLAFPWWLVPILLALATANFLVRVVRWEYYLRLRGIRVGIVESFWVFMAGLAMAISPGKVGEVLKAFLIKRRSGHAIEETTAVVIAERFTDLTAVLFLSLAGVWALGVAKDIFVAGLIMVGLFLVMVLWRAPSAPIIALIERRPRLEGLGRKIEGALEALRAMIKPVPFVAGNVVGILAWGAEALAFYLLLDALPGTDISLATATLIYAIAAIAGAVSMLPGGLIATEGSMVGLLLLLDTVPDRATAVFAVLLIRLCTLWYAVLVGALSFLVWRRRAGEAIDLDAM